MRSNELTDEFVQLSLQSKAILSAQGHNHETIVSIDTAHLLLIWYATDVTPHMSQVIIVSNRLPVSVKRDNGQLIFYPSLGGLATGLSSYANDSKNQWIGWPGIASDDLSEEDRQQIVHELSKHNCTPVFLSRKQIEEFYNGYSNSVLWPLFHELPGNRSTLKHHNPKWWASYRSVNKQYAEVALNIAETGSRIWVHDYQLMLVPEMLRSERVDLIMGFFLHIPFPKAKSFERIPEYKKLLHGILNAEVVGFHTNSYVANFIESCRAINIPMVSENEMVLPGHTVRVGHFPMGIDYQRFATAAKSKVVKAAVKKYRKRYRRLKVIVAIDRLDPTKGLIERLEAYKTFLELQPKMRGKVIFSLVAAPSRTDVPAYRHLTTKIQLLVSQINSEYGTPRWQPVDYMNVTLSFEEVTALFHIADVAFIAPIRDGMNLAAKEFIASKRKSGVLILSETAGAAQELSDAIIVNPRRPQELVDAIDQALTMHRHELRGRLKRMQAQISTHTVQDWADSFVDTLQQPIPGTPNITRTLKGKYEANLLMDYFHANRRLIFLDYDGTVVPFTKNYKDVEPPKLLTQLLKKLGSDDHNTVVLISGRAPSDLQKWFGDLPISLVAEHGAAIRRSGNKKWKTIEKVDTEWKQILRPALDKYAAFTPGARVESKPHSLVWHYRASPPYYAQKYAVIIKRAFKPVLKTYGLELLQGNKVLEIKNPRISKGKAASNWLIRGYDFMISIGDDVTDEELFTTLPEFAHSIKVGRGLTAARYRLSSPDDVIDLLKLFTK